MVEKIIVTRDEVLHYPWIDHTWLYIYYPKNSITENSFFPHFLGMILKRGISEVTGQKFEDLLICDGYVFINYGTNEIIEILKSACAWILKRNLKHNFPQSPEGAFFTENKDAFNSFWTETKKILEENSFRYFYQCVNGRD